MHFNIITSVVKKDILQLKQTVKLAICIISQILWHHKSTSLCHNLNGENTELITPVELQMKDFSIINGLTMNWTSARYLTRYSEQICDIDLEIVQVKEN